jgi:hypothetical protein
MLLGGFGSTSELVRKIRVLPMTMHVFLTGSSHTGLRCTLLNFETFERGIPNQRLELFFLAKFGAALCFSLVNVLLHDGLHY